MRKEHIQPIGDILKEYLKVFRLQSKIDETTLITSWKQVLGPSIYSYTRDLSIRNKILYVSLTSSALRNELMLMRTRLIKELNDVVGTDVIEDIKFR